ncbi:hypothetical protein FAVG1_05095 [Fusarium avenaceum]|nr:hypothetical protein FAVG1_05095 [Fusarium avenaceum]
MSAPRRSKRIQTLHQSGKGSRGITESPKALKKDHCEKRRKTAKSQREMSGVQRSGSPPEIGLTWAEQERLEDEEERRKRVRSKEYLHGAVGQQRLDPLVELAWPRLCGAIGALVDVPSLWDVPWDSLEEALQEKFLSYAPNAEELFQVPRLAGYVFQRWVWEIVDENFFSKKSKDIVWTSPYWEAQVTLERYLQEHNFSLTHETAWVKYTHWRYTAMDLYMSLKDSPRRWQRIDQKCILQIITKALGKYFPKEHSTETDPNSKGFSAVVAGLVESIATLEFYFSANFTFFSHAFHHPITQQTSGFPYSRELEGIKGQAVKSIWADDDYLGRNVDFVFEPMLLQHGHHYGFDFHVKKAVFPMRCCVAWLEDCRNLPVSPQQEGEETDEASVEEKNNEDGDDDKVKERDEDEDELTKQKEMEKNKEDKSKSKDKGRH